ncbi:hypothetical protein F4802DRAFT_528400 [Xylaria palmicola]|nr:hypothetical protein F4802DRAFT_528400 [Xylaria palmicola]
MDPNFSHDEKRFVLGEIIKVSAIDVSTIVDFIKAHKVEPNWMMMQLPSGRNMTQCIGAVNNMFQDKFQPPNPGNIIKRKSLGDLNEHPPKRQAMITTPFEPTIASVRALQPRPPLGNGYPPMVAPMASTPPVSTIGKKRGRPSKADKEAQARAAYTRPTEYPPITPAPPAPHMALSTVPPQREYASSPGYEIANTGADQSSKKRSRPTVIDSPRQAGVSFPLASPASTTGTPRGLPEPLEQVERANVSPHDNSSAPVDSRSPPLAPLTQQQDQPQTHHILPRPQAPLVPIQPLPRPLQVYERPDPIFGDRKRSTSIPDPASRNASASPVVSRT